MTLNFTLPNTHVLVSFSFTCLVSARVIVVYANESNETNMAKKCTDEAERKFGRNVKELSEEPQILFRKSTGRLLIIVAIMVT